MKVLVYTSLYPNKEMPNFGIFVKRRMEAFACRPGNDVRVVAPVPYFPRILSAARLAPAWDRFSRVPSCEAGEGLEVRHPRYPLAPKVSMQFQWLSMFLFSLPVVLRLQRNYKFDLIDGHYIYPDGMAAILLGNIIGVPVVLSARGSDVNEFGNYATIRPFLRFALRRADGLIAVCAALSRAMEDLGASVNSVKVVSNGVDVEMFHPIDRAEARLRLGIPNDVKMVVSVGSLIERKGHHILAEALVGILRDDPSVRLYIVGEGPYRGHIESRIVQLGLTDRVFLVGERANEELAFWYSAANCSCLASAREGWANVIMESFACGTPVVATNVWGAPEIITSDSLGFLAERNSLDIAEKILDSLRKPWSRGDIRKYVEARSWGNVAMQVQEVFEEVVERRR